MPSGAPALAPDAVRPAAGGENPVDTTGEGAADASADVGAITTKSGEPGNRDAAGDGFAQVLTDEAPTGPSWLVIGSLVMLVVGLTLALFRWRARRLGDG